jgi:hypothetical protein
VRAIGLTFALAIFFVAGPASALTALTNGYCSTAGPLQLGIADKIDGTGGGALGVGSGAPYNLDKMDDALVCADTHVPVNGVDTAAEFINEVANTISHELGHILGLEHGDGTAASLMNGAYDGLDKSFSAAAEQGVLNDASLNAVQVVWLDFQAAQPGLLSIYKPFSQSNILANYGITPVMVNATIASIVAQVQADYAGPWTGGGTYEFYLLEIDALNATSGSGDYSTVSIVAVPEPGSALLLAFGFGALSVSRWHRRRD